LGYTLGHRFPFQFDKDGWDILTSVGTVAAVVVALFITYKQSRDAQVAARQAAMLTGARLFNAVVELHDTTFFALEQLHNYDDTTTDHAKFLKQELFSFLDLPLMDLPNSELQVLHALGDNTGIHLARALSVLGELRRTHHLLIERDNVWMVFTPELRIGFTKKWTASLSNAVGFLSVAGRSLIETVGHQYFDSKGVLDEFAKRS
jgi:hypothetical protein